MTASRSRFRPVQVVVLALVLVPVWKVVEPLFRSGPRAASPEAVRAGRELFVHEWRPGDSLTGGDGLGPVFNAASCVECHSQGGPGGGGPVSKNVTVYGLVEPHPRGLPQSGVVHQKATSRGFQETLSLVHPALPPLPSIPLDVLTNRSRSRPSGVVVTQRNTPALFGAGLVDDVTEEAIIAHQREHSTPARLVGLNGATDSRIRGKIARLADGRVGRFGWKLEFATLEDFVKAACANELGLSNPGRPQATPLGRPGYAGKGTDLTDEQCRLMTDYIRSLPQPVSFVPREPALAAAVAAGSSLFHSIGCADCHTKTLSSVPGIYSDLLLHDMGVELESSTGYYGSIIPAPAIRNEKFDSGDQPSPVEWRTAPLWGVADSAPYLHDGRAESLEEAIEAHGGEAVDVTARWKALSEPEQRSIVAFLKTLKAPAGESAPVRRTTLAAR